MADANRDLRIGRNTALLSASLASLFGMGQLTAAVATLTFALVTGIEGLLGLGPAIVLASAALAALPAGRAMDRFGRVPVLATGFVVGGLGTLLTGIGALTSSIPAVTLGFFMIGCGNGIGQLTRTAAGDMYPPERRARGISLVLAGAVFGALLGPFVFSPLFAGKHHEARELAVPWFAAGGFMLLGLVLVLNVRPDPKRIAQILAGGGQTAAASAPAAPLGQILRRPGVVPALLAALASFGVMVSIMNLTGYIVIGHGHAQHSVFSIISAHFVGMFALVLVVGGLIDRVGRLPAIVSGLLLVAASTKSLLWIQSVVATAVALFVLGLGWNFSYVAATAELVELTTLEERGRILGFSDLCSALFGAGLALLGGFAFTETGVEGLSIGVTVIALAPAVLLLVRSRVRSRPAFQPAP